MELSLRQELLAIKRYILNRDYQGWPVVRSASSHLPLHIYTFTYESPTIFGCFCCSFSFLISALL